jgi:hypothetical protein
MANGASTAVDNATRLPEIGFPEFTAQLITDTFNAITSSYIDQTAQYIQVVQAVSKTLQDFINNTVDDVSADEIGAFLVSLGNLNDAALSFLLGDSTATASLSAAEATRLNNAVVLPPAAGSATGSTITSGNLSASKKQSISDAIARRIATNKYDLLQTMVRQGVLRLYVDNGTIETRLTFTAYGSAVKSSSQTNLERVAQASASGHALGGGFGVFGGLGGGVFGGSASGAEAKASLSVSTANATQRDVTGSRVQIYGRVRLNFKTDLVPLAAPQT